jgi:hypothetical protein
MRLSRDRRLLELERLYRSRHRYFGELALDDQAILAALSCVFTFAPRRGYINAHPFDRLERDEPTASAPLRSARPHPRRTRTSLRRMPRWYRPLLLTGAYTGMRLSEVLGAPRSRRARRTREERLRQPALSCSRAFFFRPASTSARLAPRRPGGCPAPQQNAAAAPRADFLSASASRWTSVSAGWLRAALDAQANDDVAR